MIPFFKDSFDVGYDNYEFHFRDFAYYSESLRHGYGFPRWYPFEGGIPTGITNISLLSLLPYRILGYLMYIFLHIKPIVAYKISLVVGVISIGLGWWLFLYKLIKSKLAATVGCLTLIFKISMFSTNAEQSVASISYIPWILFIMVQIKNRFSLLTILAILCGFSMLIHYPHYQLITLLSLFLSLLLTGKINFLFSLKMKRKKIFIILLALVFFLLAVLPALYLQQNCDEFACTLRKVKILSVKSYEQYKGIIELQPPINKRQLKMFLELQPLPIESENWGFTIYGVTPIQLFLIILGIFYFRFSIPAVIVLLFSSWAALGTNGNLPYLLFKMRLPFISYFREYWLFLFSIILCISFLTALGAASSIHMIRTIITFICKISNHRKLYYSILMGVTSTILIMPLVSYYKRKSDIFANKFATYADLEIPRYDKKEFSESLKSNIFAKPSAIFTYREWWDLREEDCRELTAPWITSKRPFITRNIFNDINAKSSFKTHIKEFCKEDLRLHAVIASIPAEKVRDIKMPVISIIDRDTELKYLDSTNNYYLADDEYTVTPKGAKLKVNAINPGFLVFPYSYKLRLKAYLDNKRVETYPVFNGAMTGVFVPEGKFNLDFTMPFTIYEISLVIQGILVIFIPCYLIVMCYKFRCHGD